MTAISPRTERAASPIVADESLSREYFKRLFPFLCEFYIEIDSVEEMGGANSSHWTLSNHMTARKRQQAAILRSKGALFEDMIHTW